VQTIVDSGEWDTNWLLHLLFIEDDTACWGVLPLSLVVEGGTPYARFCIKEGCTVASHAKQKIPQERRITGWYLEAGGATRQGACLDIMFLQVP